MTEQVLSAEATGAVPSSNVTTTSSPVSEGFSNSTSQPNVKTLSQEQIDQIARDAHARGYSKRDKELLSNQQQPQTYSQPSINLDEVKKIAFEEAQRASEQARLQAEAQVVVGQFAQKLQTAAAKYPDFAEKAKAVDFSRMANIVPLLNAVDNTGDVMYELVSNPSKIAMLQSIAATQPGLVDAEIARLSKSIATNQQAQAPNIPPPVSQLQHSPIGVSSDGLPDHDYFKSKYRG